MNLAPGMLVVYRPRSDLNNGAGMPRRPDANYPAPGLVYTIATVNDWPLSTLVTLAEVSNADFQRREGFHIEPGFDSRHFVPVDESRIAVFKRIAASPKERIRIGEEA